MLNNTKISHRKLRQPRHLSQSETAQTQECESPPGSEPCSPTVFTSTKTNLSEVFQNGETTHEIYSKTVSPVDTEQSPQGKAKAKTNDNNGVLDYSVCSKKPQTFSETLQKGELSKDDHCIQSAMINTDVTNEQLSSPNNVLMNSSEQIEKGDKPGNAKDTGMDQY